MKKIISPLLLLSVILSSCVSITPEPTQEASVTQVHVDETPTEETVVENVSQLGVNEASLNGLEITVWLPWFGIEANLFNNFVNEFNSTNEWGIKVNTQNKTSFANLYETTTASNQAR